MTNEILEFVNIAAFNAYEARMKLLLNIPIIPTNKATGLPRPDLPSTVNYTTPIPHPEAADVKQICYIDENGDKTGETVVTQNTAKTRGWFVPEELPFGILEATGAASSQTIGIDFTTINQFDVATKARGINAIAPADRITISTPGRYELEYVMEFTGTIGRKYTIALFINNAPLIIDDGQVGSEFPTVDVTDASPVTTKRTAFVDLTAGNVVELRVLSSEAGSDLKILSGNFMVSEVEA